MSDQLSLSMFQEVFFPPSDKSAQEAQEVLRLESAVQFKADPLASIAELPIVVFDFETTGLDEENERIIEIGAIKSIGGQVVGEYHTLISPDIPLTDRSTQITGITPAMLKGQPRFDQVYEDFINFIQGSVLVAHNARFDWGFLFHSGLRLGKRLSWPCFCTMLLSQKCLPGQENYKLDTLAKHFQLTFEARHRSIGDCKVTLAVLLRILKAHETQIKTWSDLRPYTVAG